MKLKGRIAQIRKSQELTVLKFAEKLEETPMLISGIESGRIKTITPGLYEKLHNRFSIDLNWLITGSGEMLMK